MFSCFNYLSATRNECRPNVPFQRLGSSLPFDEFKLYEASDEAPNTVKS